MCTRRAAGDQAADSRRLTGRALAAALEKNRHVLELELSGNKLTEDSLRQIDLLLRRNRGEVYPFPPNPS